MPDQPSQPVPPLLAPPVISQAPPPLPIPSSTGRPGVVLAYRWWCVLFVVLYLAMAVSEILVACGIVEPSMGLLESIVSHNNQKVRDEIIADKRAEAPGVATFMALIAVFYIVAAAVPRKPWGWTLGIIALATTLFPFVVTAAGMVPMLMYWAKRTTKLYFNRRP